MANLDNDDDLFADSRMSFGDHIEELRTRMWFALKATVVCMFIGFILDGIGTQLDIPWLGVGKPVLAMIKAPVEEQMLDFYNSRIWDAEQQLNPPKDDAERRQRERDKPAWLAAKRKLQDDKDVTEVSQPKSLAVTVSAADIVALRAAKGDGDVTLHVSLSPLELAILLSSANNRIGKGHKLTTLSAQEGFVVYFKVSLLCGVVLACPIIFWQFWAFVAAGMYPQEKKYVHQYFPFSIGLFLVGIVLCQVFVLPGAVKALLGFNEWLELDPDLRLNEWLGLALILPLVFGLSFQTPLVMLALNRIGMFSPEDYQKYWRHATMILAFFSAVITPTPDAVTMMYLFIPMIGLYFFGIWLCRLFPQPKFDDDENLDDAGVAV